MAGDAAADAAPLISHNRHPEDDDGNDGDEGLDGEGRELVSETQLGGNPGAFIWVLTISAGISGLLFGYDTGVISATLVSIGADLSQRPLSTFDKSVITSCTSLFALLASPLTGVFADRWGRKKVLVLADALFIIGALWQAVTETRGGMVAGRSVVGFAVGGASLVVPLYDIPLENDMGCGYVADDGRIRRWAGRLVTVSILFITFGQVVAYIVGYLFSHHEHGWRWMVGLGALPAAVQLATLAFLPETPRWLVKAGREAEAREVLEKVFGTQRGSASNDSNRMVDGVMRGIERERRQEERQSSLRLAAGGGPAKLSWKDRLPLDRWRELFSVGGNRRALVITCMLQGLQQLCGFNSLMYFSATIFSMVGFDNPTMAALSVAVTNFVFTMVAFVLIDRAGRRRILLGSIPIMVIGLILCAVAFSFINLSSATQTADPTGRSTIWPLIILISMIIYVCGYAIGLGNVPWQQSEMFPLSVRSLGSSLSTATNWGSNFLIGLTFLPMMDVLTPTGTFVFYATVCVAGWAAVWKIYPETTGLSLEEVGGLLAHGWGVEESLRRFN
ncbi:MAG: fatty-acyl coenzyme A oxidase [Chaenotheca gracillima]|nr:MAG: fatty-acyl coenzyme A oxidase [Chaenotheca gracillima]